MESNTKYFHLLYPISPAYANQLKGVFSADPANLGQFLSFHGNKYQVHKLLSVKARLFVASGTLKLYCGFDTMEGKDKINSFLNKCGIQDQKAFIAAFFVSCVVSGTVAERTLTLNCFISTNPFIEKW